MALDRTPHELIALVCTALILGLCVQTLIFGRARYRRFKAMALTEDRQRHLRRMIAASALRYGVTAILGLLLLGGTAAVWRFPPELEGLRAPIIAAVFDPKDPEAHEVAAMLAGGMLGGFVLASLLIPLVLGLRGRSKQPMLGDVASLLPRNAAEARLCAILSLSAGVFEELHFRLFVPLSLYGVMGSLVPALILSVAIFGISHLYQGWVGALATLLLGALFMGVYIVSASLPAAMALHAFIDLRTLVIAPAITTGVASILARRSAARSERRSLTR